MQSVYCTVPRSSGDGNKGLLYTHQIYKTEATLYDEVFGVIFGTQLSFGVTSYPSDRDTVSEFYMPPTEQSTKERAFIISHGQDIKKTHC